MSNSKGIQQVVYLYICTCVYIIKEEKVMNLGTWEELEGDREEWN